MTTNTFTCRSCGSSQVSEILSLGKTPLANALLSKDELNQKEETFPLDLVKCNKCTLVQITETVAPEKLFRHYLYFSSFSEAMVSHAKKIVDTLVQEEGLGSSSLAGEIASNDGYLLQHYKNQGVPVLGIEPAVNVAEVAIRERGVNTISEFFGLELAKKLASEGKQVDTIHANNVLAHVADLNGVVAGFEAWLKDSGVVVVEAPYIKPFLEHVEFDTIYHEHLCYFSLTALDALFARHGLHIHRVERLKIHGGSVRVFASKVGKRVREQSVTDLLSEEVSWGVSDHFAYEKFRAGVANVRTKLRELVVDLRVQGKTIAAYGASAKGATLLNYCGIGAEYIEFAADKSTYKQGKYMPGVQIPVVAPSELLHKKPDYCLLLTWNFADEILAQQAEYRSQGGKFILPVPEPKVV